MVNWLKGIAGRSSSGDAPTDDRDLDFKKPVKHVFLYGFIELADDMLFALLVGVALGGVLFLALPSDLMANEYARWLSYPVMVLIGIPLYICASASTPIAAALVAKGVSPGAALIFLMTGSATNTGTMTIIVSQFGTRFASIYVAAVIAVTVVLGIAIDALLLAAGLTISVNLPRRLPFAGHPTSAMGKRLAPHRPDRLALPGRCPAQRLRGYAAQYAFPIQHGR